MLELCQLGFPEKRDAELVIRLNAALDEFAEDTELVRKTSSALTPQAGQDLWLSLPTGFKALLDVYSVSTTTKERLTTKFNFDINRSGDKIKLQDAYDKRWLYLQANTGIDVIVDYLAAATPMSLTTLDVAVEPLIPSMYHDAIAYRAMEPLHFAAGRIPEARFCRERYEEARKKGKMLARRNFTKLYRTPLTEMEM
jgi:hypothetical protein